jgi:nucleoside-diphosphate-sugar epimerase
MPTRKKIGLIGAGNIGGELARLLANKELGDVWLYDIAAKENFAKGKALDLEQNGSVLGYDASIRGTSNWEDLKGADVLIITAGIPRKPGQSRDDLVASNLPIIRNVARTRSSSSSRTRSTRWSTNTSAWSAARKKKSWAWPACSTPRVSSYFWRVKRASA